MQWCRHTRWWWHCIEFALTRPTYAASEHSMPPFPSSPTTPPPPPLSLPPLSSTTARAERTAHAPPPLCNPPPPPPPFRCAAVPAPPPPISDAIFPPLPFSPGSPNAPVASSAPWSRGGLRGSLDAALTLVRTEASSWSNLGSGVRRFFGYG